VPELFTEISGRTGFLGYEKLRRRFEGTTSQKETGGFTDPGSSSIRQPWKCYVSAKSTYVSLGWRAKAGV